MLLRVLVYEQLFGAGEIKGGGAVKRAILQAEPVLRRSLAKFMKKRGVESIEELIPASQSADGTL